MRMQEKLSAVAAGGLICLSLAAFGSATAAHASTGPAAGPVSCSTIYGIYGSAIYAIDPTTGSSALVGGVTIAAGAGNALAVVPPTVSSPYAGMLLFNNKNSTAGSPLNLYAFDPVTGTTTLVVQLAPAGSLTSLKGAWNPVTNQYWYTVTGGSTTSYYTWDPTTNAVTLQFTRAGGDNGDIAFDASGNMYEIRDTGLVVKYSAPITNGTEVNIATVPGFSSMTGTLAFAPDGTLQTLKDDATRYSINVTTGAVTQLSDVALPLEDFASCAFGQVVALPTPVGEPSIMAGTGAAILALVGGTALMRRRKQQQADA